MNIKKLIIVGVIVVLCFGLFATNVTEKKQFTNFKLEDAKGKVHKLNEYLGKSLILVDFWASYCDPCKKALPHLQELKDEYGVEVITVSTDTPKLKRKAIRYLKSHKYDFVGLYDVDGKVANKMNVKEIPYTFILDNEGNILYQFNSGRVNALETLKSEIEKGLAAMKKK